MFCKRSQNSRCVESKEIVAFMVDSLNFPRHGVDGFLIEAATFTEQANRWQFSMIAIQNIATAIFMEQMEFLSFLLFLMYTYFDILWQRLFDIQ